MSVTSSPKVVQGFVGTEIKSESLNTFYVFWVQKFGPLPFLLSDLLRGSGTHTNMSSRSWKCLPESRSHSQRAVAKTITYLPYNTDFPQGERKQRFRIIGHFTKHKHCREQRNRTEDFSVQFCLMYRTLQNMRTVCQEGRIIKRSELRSREMPCRTEWGVRGICFLSLNQPGHSASMSVNTRANLKADMLLPFPLQRSFAPEGIHRRGQASLLSLGTPRPKPPIGYQPYFGSLGYF